MDIVCTANNIYIYVYYIYTHIYIYILQLHIILRDRQMDIQHKTVFALHLDHLNKFQKTKKEYPQSTLKW